ncbi:hypothetical protein [Rhizobium sp. 007]|uniref:hypothetical protein n=1 Tax=Rhizobium sp. 007 TaxID=2785056 RepID=UPI00188E806E|nr:hypothetical protein [Rhizobium sp. 007]QPB20917.1 hypothetical protein ISN39_05325 [Rhizobium sp. 007]
MKTISLVTNVATLLVLLVLAAAPIFLASPAEARRAAAACGRHGCAAAAYGPRGCAAGAATRRPRPRGVVVVSPNRYWRPGCAIAAGAAIGFIAGAGAASDAGTPPQPGYCWYYTNSAKTTGFWDVCPK